MGRCREENFESRRDLDCYGRRRGFYCGLKEIRAKNIECIMSFEDIIVYSRPSLFSIEQEEYIEYISHASVNDSALHDS